MIKRGFAIRRLFSESGHVVNFKVRTKSAASNDCNIELNRAIRTSVRYSFVFCILFAVSLVYNLLMALADAFRRYFAF